MKKLRNPTNYFFEQAENTITHTTPQIQEFVKKLLNRDQCLLCKNDYDAKFRIPRILIHCGHTFCTLCLQEFFTNRRVRCPMCLKLVKKIQSLERLPINHTIYKYLVEKESKESENNNIQEEKQTADQFLFRQFQRIQKQAHMKQEERKFDEQSGLPFCIFHSDRIQHFYCETHKTSGCRVCIEVGHSRPDCTITDLYALDSSKYLEYQEKLVFNQNEGPSVTKKKENMFNFNAEEQDYDANLFENDDDDSDEIDANKSV